MRTPVGRARLVALARPAWAALSRDVVALLGDDVAREVTDWALGASESEVLAAVGARTYSELNSSLGKLRREGGPWSELPRGNAWTPTPAQVTQGVRYLEGRVAYQAIIDLLGKIGPRPSLYQFRLWAADAYGTRGTGRPPGPSPRVQAALDAHAADPDAPLSVTAAKCGVTTQTLKRALRDMDTAP
jgi:hypothetical protein